jgi:hypothetical protein
MGRAMQDEDGQGYAKNTRASHGSDPRAYRGRRIARQVQGRARSSGQVEGQHVGDGEEDLHVGVSRMRFARAQAAR